MTIKNPLVERLALLYGEPKTHDVKAFVNAYVNELSGFDRPVLQFAADHIARTRKVSAWPTIGECIEALEFAKHQVSAGGVKLKPIGDFNTWFGDLIDQIKGANSEREIGDAIGKIRPYVDALWVAPYRLSEALAVAEKRRASNFGTGLTDKSKAMAGDDV